MEQQKDWTAYYRDCFEEALASNEVLQAMIAERQELLQALTDLNIKAARLGERANDLEAGSDAEVEALVENPNASMAARSAEVATLRKAQAKVLEQARELRAKIEFHEKRMDGPARKALNSVHLQEQPKLDSIQQDLLDRLFAYETAREQVVAGAAIPGLGNYYGSAGAHLNVELLKEKAPHRDTPMIFDKTKFNDFDPRRVTHSEPDPGSVVARR